MSFSSEVYTSFKKLAGVPATIVGLILALIPFFYAPSASVGWKFIIPAAIAIFMIVAVLLDISIRLYGRVTSPLPKVLRSLAKPEAAFGTKFGLLLLEPSELFGTQTMVSIYRKSDGFEVFVGWGIASIQQDKKVQVLVKDILPDDEDKLWTSVLNNDSKSLQELIIKPNIPANLNCINTADYGRIQN